MHNIPLSFISEDTLEAVARHHRAPRPAKTGLGSFRRALARLSELLLNFDGPNSVLNFERAMRGDRRSDQRHF